PTTDNRQPTTDNRQPTTDNRQPTTDNRQPTTDNRQPTTDNRQPTTLHMRHLKPFLILAVILGSVVLLRMLPVRELVEGLLVVVQELGPLGPVLLVLAYVVTSVFLIPGSAMTLLIGGAYGLWKGLLIVVVGANLAAAGSFLLSRTFLRDRVSRWAAGYPKFAALDRAIGREGFRMVLLSRLSPVFPFTLLNYFLGLTTVRFGSYALANLIGMLPGTFLYVYLGATAREALTGSTGLAVKIVGLAATIAVVAMVTRMARKAMADVESEDAAALSAQEAP
ncbi:MAG: TVP38/TMEM64 family protein, partial [Blastocatellia bacterium]|nr:TVP38/TMEM64 family protein [Blastocatellia bacterium]